jgi:Swt1-like HEPN
MTDLNREIVGRGLEILGEGLGPFVNSRMIDVDGSKWRNRFPAYGPRGNAKVSLKDAHFLLKVMRDGWHRAFRTWGLTQEHQRLVDELYEVRNRWAHPNGPFSEAATDRALDQMETLLTAVDAPQDKDIRRLKPELARRRRVRDEDHSSRAARQKAAQRSAWQQVKPTEQVSDRLPHKAEIPVVPPPGPPQVGDKNLCPGVIAFIDDEAGFVNWRDSHSTGYIVNCHRQPQADYVKLHRSTCTFLNKRWTYTRDYIKFCAENKQMLIDWVWKLFGGGDGPDPCPFCKP